MERKKKIRIAVFIIAFAVFAFVLYRMFFQADLPAENVPELAMCLAERGVVMYGAEWCSHCQNQKKLFGESFKLVAYVECPDEPDVCTAMGIEGYPTWVFPDGRWLVGEQSIELLAREAGCELPAPKE